MVTEEEAKEKVREKAQEKAKTAKSEVSENIDTIRNDRTNAPRKLKYTIKKYYHWILLFSVLGLTLYIWLFGGITIPQWVWLVIAGSVATMIVLYPYAKWFANYFIEDNRRPVLEIGDDTDEGFGFHWVPNDRVGDVEFIEDSPVERPTSEGMGWEVREFNVYEENGYQYIEAKGTWKGSMPALDLDRKESEIETMRVELERKAKKGHKYEIKLPQIIHRIERIVTNELTYQFQGITNFKGKEIHSEVEQITRSEIEEIEELESEKQENESDELEETMKELTEILESGDEQ